MWKYLKEYKYHNIGIVMLIAVSDLLGISMSFIMMKITDLIIKGDFGMLLKTMVVCLVVVETNILLAYACKVLKAKTIALMNSRMREEISRKLQRKSFQKFAEHDSGEYLSWYTNDIREAENQGFLNLYNCIDSTIKLAAGAVALVFIKIDLLICTLIVAALSLCFSQRFEKKVEKSSEKVSAALEQFTNTVKQQISGFGMLKSFRRLNKFEDDMCDAGKTMEEQRCRFIKEREKAGIGLGFVNTAGFNLVNVYCYALCTLRVIPVESIVGCVNLVNIAGNSFEQLIKTRLLLAGAKPYFKKINDIEADEMNDGFLQGVGDVKNKMRRQAEQGRTEQLPMLKNNIKVENLEFSYTDTPILRGLNLDFKIGGKYVIVGKSGCGKSTLLKLLLGQLTNYRGEILFDDKEAGIYITDSFYNQMAYIEQTVFMFNTTIRENITMGDNFTEAEMEEALRKSALWQDMDHFPEGLDTKVGENGKNLSGGQKQRVAIARALIHNRSILIVDEGTSALDQENAAAIEDALLGCDGLTLIIVSHHLREEKRKYYTDVYRLENGRRVTA